MAIIKVFSDYFKNIPTNLPTKKYVIPTFGNLLFPVSPILSPLDAIALRVYHLPMKRMLAKICALFWKWVALTDQRRKSLSDFFLNLAVVSFGFAAYENKWPGFVAAVLCVCVFFILTVENKK